METITFGEIRKRVEVTMHKRLGIDITQDQIARLRTLAPEVAEGKMLLNDAISEVEKLEFV